MTLAPLPTRRSMVRSSLRLAIHTLHQMSKHQSPRLRREEPRDCLELPLCRQRGRQRNGTGTKVANHRQRLQIRRSQIPAPNRWYLGVKEARARGRCQRVTQRRTERQQSLRSRTTQVLLLVLLQVHLPRVRRERRSLHWHCLRPTRRISNQWRNAI